VSLARATAARIGYAVLSPVSWALHVSGICSGPLALRGFERLRWNLGRLGVWIRFQSAARRVPAYAALLRQSGVENPMSNIGLRDIPSMDKSNYVIPFPLESRCVGGRFPATGVMVDESSGSSGLPTNWVRGVAERNANRRTLKFGLRYRLGSEPLFFLNAFALGPWATGVNLTLSLAQWTRIKTIGPDLSKIENTLLQFGPAHHYVIMGYPPFLKQLVDRAKIDWKLYRVSMLYGGEGMSESMRRYLQAKGIKQVYGSYGASDLELNIAAETDLTIALRRLLEQRPALAAGILKHPGAMPMIFQFNPADFFFETNDDGELLVTICRPRYIAPKIRYNIHDLGHVLRVPELRRVLAVHGVTMEELDDSSLDLPLLFHYGRSDASVAYYGCKISPADVQESLFRHPELASGIDAFQLRTFEDDEGDKRMVLSLEITSQALRNSGEHSEMLLFNTLAEINQDFRESRRMVSAGKEPTIELFDAGTGPFAGADIRIKRTYVNRDALS
jgi:phenylacetate-CoA ligase